MVILKTESQVRSFIKRMNKKHSFSHDEGCGCCFQYSYIQRDNNRVLLKTVYSSRGSMEMSCGVLARIKG